MVRPQTSLISCNRVIPPSGPAGYRPSPLRIFWKNIKTKDLSCGVLRRISFQTAYSRFASQVDFHRFGHTEQSPQPQSAQKLTANLLYSPRLTTRHSPRFSKTQVSPSQSFAHSSKTWIPANPLLFNALHTLCKNTQGCGVC